MILFASTALLAFALALAVTPVIRQAAVRYGVMDHPDGKLKQQTEPVPYLGGLAVYIAFLGTLALTYDFRPELLGMLLAASLTVIVGLFDDLRVLSPRAKLLGQIAATLVLIKAGVSIQIVAIPQLPAWFAPMPGILRNLPAYAVTLLWIVGITNALNILDVMDGLATGVAAVAAACFAALALWDGDQLIAITAVSLAGSLLGFLRYNFQPAKIYLGDTGALFVGIVLGALAMIPHYTLRTQLALCTPLLVLGVPLFEITLVMIARRRQGLPVMRGSPDHYALRLRAAGWPVRRIALGSYAVAGALGGAALLLVRLDGPAAAVLLGVVLVTGLTALVLLLRLPPPQKHP